MNRSVLQIPIDNDLKTRAIKVANKKGFSSLQEIIKIFLSQLAANRLDIRFSTKKNCP